MGEQNEPVQEEAAVKMPEETQEIVLKVEMHCEGCAKKVEKSLLRFEGVQDVKADSRSKTVVVKSRTADPGKVCERIQMKTKRRVELISPIPPLPPEEEKKEDTPPPPPPEEKKDEPPKTITVILKVQMHCESCAQLLQKHISRIEGVESVVTDLPNDQVMIKGVMDPAVLTDIIQRKTRRPAVILKEEMQQEEEKKQEKGEKKPKEKKAEADGSDGELKKYEFWPPVGYYVEYVYSYPPPPLVPLEFNDENPNACTVV